ncbi:MAG: hypothetical protein E8D45_03900 [Nitrospira sp.]|nr:MAG: hypothetical protein E8D45_03900 [Nitrospira sp.]
MEVWLTPASPVPQATVSARSVEYPILIDYVQGFTQNVPKDIRDKIYLDVTVISKPHWDHLNTVQPKTRLWRFSLGLYEPGHTGVPGPMVVKPIDQVHWIDQDVMLRVELWVDPTLVVTAMTPPNEKYRKDLFITQNQVIQGRNQAVESPAWLRTLKSPLSRVSPYLIPIAIIGRPPGNQSWASMTVESGAGASLAVKTSNSSSVSTQSSFGLGPIDIFNTPTETIWRTSGTGVYRNFTFQSTTGRQTNNPYDIGTGDLMVAILRPTFETYETTGDFDFKYVPSSQGVATTVSFPMQELMSPRPGTPPALLNQAENAAMRNLDPLLADRRARLDSPRYLLVRSEIFSGTALSCDTGMREITKDEVQQALGNSSATTSSSSVTIPIGSVLGAITGSPIPIPDPTSRTTETTTVSAEYGTTRSLERSNGVLVSYRIADSDPAKWLYVEVYYDTFFRTFAFRDASTPPVQASRDQLNNAYQFGARALGGWQTLRGQDPVRFMVAGSVASIAPQGGLAKISAPGKAPTYVTVAKGTGNLMVPNLTAGQYTIEVQGRTAPLTVDSQGRVALGAFGGITGTVKPNPPVTISPVPMQSGVATLQLPRAIVNENSGKCFDNAGGVKNDGANLQQFTCHGGLNQQWELKAVTGNMVEIVNKNSGKCLDVAGGSKNDGANVQQFGCHGGSNQRWTMTALTGGMSQFINQNSGKCLDVTGGSKNDGANIQQFTCHGGPSQRYSLSASPVRSRGVDIPEGTQDRPPQPAQ